MKIYVFKLKTRVFFFLKIIIVYAMAQLVFLYDNVCTKYLKYLYSNMSCKLFLAYIITSYMYIKCKILCFFKLKNGYIKIIFLWKQVLINKIKLLICLYWKKLLFYVVWFKSYTNLKIVPFLCLKKVCFLSLSIL